MTNKNMHILPLSKNRPFWALFGTQFLGAFNDNFFRSALVTLITYHLVTYSAIAKSLFVSVAFGLFMFPFFVFSPLAGQLADRFDKSRIIRFVKGAEILIVSLSAYGFIYENPYFLLGALFFMGVHSAFFGPAKYSLLPEILSQETLLEGNGYMEAGTFLAIMLGTLTGALMVHWEISMSVLSFQLFIVSLMGFGVSWQLPRMLGRARNLKIRFSWISEMRQLYRFTQKDIQVFKAVIAIAWFWLVGATLLAQLPPFAKEILRVEESVFVFLLFLFTLGIGTGSILCSWIFKGEITTRPIPLLSLFMIPLLFDLSSFHSPLASTPTSLLPFLTSFQGLRLSADIFGLSFIGGLFVVPLYTFIQATVIPSHLSQVIAFNNIMNAGFMVFASMISFVLLSLGMSVSTLIELTAVGQIVMTIYVIRILPEKNLKAYLYTLLKLLFRLDVNGLENYKLAGKRVILIANHASYLDALLIAAILPEKPLFAINRFTAQKWWIKPFLVLAKVFPVDPLYPYALRDIIEEAKKGHKVLIFPEGRLTLTGSLMKIYEGPGMVAEKAEARILPIRLDGTQYTFFSLLKGKLPRKFFPKITITLLPPQSLDVDPTLIGRARRHALSEYLYGVMTTMMFTTSPLNKTLFEALIESRRLYGTKTPVLEDTSRTVLTYGGLLGKSFAFSQHLARITTPREVVGLMLPNAHGLIVSFWALQAIGRIPGLLNYASGAASLLATAQLAQLQRIYTSRQFVEKARLQEAIDLFKHAKIQVYYLEDEIKKIRLRDRLWGFYGRLFPEHAYIKSILGCFASLAMTEQSVVAKLQRNRLATAKPSVAESNPEIITIDPQDSCVILFTSGSEGLPKGVPLSHFNLQANRYQLASVVDFNEMDTVLNVLPLFHAFGLTAGMILPLLSGIKTFHYISPLHYRVVAELIYDIGATILFGTDTFLSGYGRVAHVYDFRTLRFVFAGAEKLKSETQAVWYEKFGLRIFEGYGTTETGPVLCVNTTMHYKAGTVGRFLPGISYRLEPVKEIKDGGRLWVKGPNVMREYLTSNWHPEFISRSLRSPNNPRSESRAWFGMTEEEWYDTGDIAEVDKESYVTLKGRAKRFAKVGGETISLTAVEEAVARLWPEYTHAVITRPDPKKGEQLVLYTTRPSATKPDLISFWKKEGLSELSLPKVLMIFPSLPLLGSGKVDYRALPFLETV